MDNPYLQILKRVQSTSTLSTTTETLEDYDLGGVDCKECNNTGHIVYLKDGMVMTRECSCMNTRRSLRRIRKSGMADMLKRFTFDSYEAEDAERLKVKQRAVMFSEADTGWLYIAGQSGSGKTHICTAVCNRLMERGKNVYYMLWRDESRHLKALMNTSDIDDALNKLKTIPVLYVDDFFKGGSNDADVRIAFEILNSRYNDTSLRTLISSEYSLSEICQIDEALGSRIYERSKGYRLKAPNENWRLK